MGSLFLLWLESEVMHACRFGTIENGKMMLNDAGNMD
jgi:hypothetical protein